MRAQKVIDNAIGRGYYSHDQEAAITDKIAAAVTALEGGGGQDEFDAVLLDIEEEAYMIGGALAHRKFDSHPIPWDEDKSPAENMGL